MAILYGHGNNTDYYLRGLGIAIRSLYFSYCFKYISALTIYTLKSYEKNLFCYHLTATDFTHNMDYHPVGYPAECDGAACYDNYGIVFFGQFVLD